MSEQLRIRWDNADSEENGNPLPESNLKTLKVIGKEYFNLEKFGKVDSEIISDLSHLIDMDPQNKCQVDLTGASPLTSPRPTPKTSTHTVDTTQTVISEKPIARMFAGHMVQTAGLRVIMLFFASSSVEEITSTNTCRTILTSLIQQAARPSSLEVGVPLNDLLRAGNVMLASAMGQASPWDSRSSVYEESELINTSDEDEMIDDDEDDDMMDTETEEDADPEEQVQQQTGTHSTGGGTQPGPTALHSQGVAAIETVLMEHQRRLREVPQGPGDITNQGQQTFGSNSDTNPSRRTSILRPASFAPPIVSQTIAPPSPPSPITQLIEMGFTMAHVQRGMRSLNISNHQNQNTSQTSTQIAMLAAWLIENPQEPGEEPNVSNPAQEVDSSNLLSMDNARPLFELDPALDNNTGYDIIDQPSTTIIMDGSESTTSIGMWPGNVLPQTATYHPSIIELGDENPRLRDLYNIFKEGAMHANEVEDLSTGMPSPPRKLLEIASKLGLGDNEIPDSVKFAKSDPLGSDSILLRNILDERVDSDRNEAIESLRKYRLSQQIGKTTMSWTEKCQVMNSITQATKVLAARHIVLRALALATVQVSVNFNQ